MLDMNIRQSVDSGLYSCNDSVEEEVCLRVSKAWRFAARQIGGAWGERWQSQLAAAELAVDGVVIVSFGGANRAGTIVDRLAERVGHLDRDDTGGHRDDRIAQDHDESGQKLTQIGTRSDVAVPHRGQGDDGPVDTAGMLVKPFSSPSITYISEPMITTSVTTVKRNTPILRRFRHQRPRQLPGFPR